MIHWSFDNLVGIYLSYPIWCRTEWYPYDAFIHFFGSYLVIATEPVNTRASFGPSPYKKIWLRIVG